MNDKKAYITHRNYIGCINNLASGLSIFYEPNLRKADIKNSDCKENLINLTCKSLADEYKIVQIDKEYSYASTSWLPVKSYYLIFNRLLSILYLINLQNSCYNYKHSTCINTFTNFLEKEKITFSEPVLNTIFDRSILKYKTKVGSNLSSNISHEHMYKMAMRKIAQYKAESFKMCNGLNIRAKKDKAKYEKFLNSMKISFFDFSYFMRVKANYRDFAFIEDITSDDTSQYFELYYKFTVNFYNALTSLHSTMKQKRIN